MMILAVFFGATVGAVCRYLFTEFVPVLKIKYKVDATFLINIVGSFTLGLLFHYFAGTSIIYLLLGTGFCGGFTTFSTFNSEMMGLMYDKKYRWLLAYGIGSYVVGMFAGILGYLV